MLTSILLNAGLLPLIVSAAIAFILRRFRSPISVVWPVAVAAGFLTSQFVLRGQNGLAESLLTFLQPPEAIDWLPHIVLLALGVSIVMHLAPANRGLSIAMAAALCIAAPVRLLSGNVAVHWSMLEKLAWLSLLAAVLGAVWILLATDDEARPAFVRVPLLIAVAVGTAIVVTQSGVLVYGESCAALGAALSGTALVFAFRAHISSAGAAAAAGVITFTLGSLIILAHFFAALSVLNAALLFASLVATSVPLPAAVRSGSWWLPVATRVIACLLPLAAAVIGVLG
jgi:hypothetical protein